jgi:hypothetical protein
VTLEVIVLLMVLPSIVILNSGHIAIDDTVESLKRAGVDLYQHLGTN